MAQASPCRRTRAPSAHAAAAAAPVLGLLAMQEAAGADAADHAARAQGEALVAELGALQLALLSGAAAPGGGRLASLARSPATAADPRLAAVLGALRLRAEVELARAALGAAAQQGAARGTATQGDAVSGPATGLAGGAALRRKSDT